MLTTMFYYEYYKPYVVKEAGDDAQHELKRRIIGKASLEKLKDASFLLNKSLKKDVIQYALDIAKHVLATKDSARDLVQNLENFNQTVYRVGARYAQESVAQTLAALADTYNRSVEFLANQQHSQALQNFASSVSANLTFNGGSLLHLSLETDNKRKMVFNDNSFYKLSENDIHMAIGANINLFQNIYEDAREVLRIPLTEHMNFKDLNYYYNYKFGSIHADTFKIIQSGMLVDEAV